MRETVREHDRPRLAVAPPAAVDADQGPSELDRASSFLVRNWLVIGTAALLGAVAALVGSFFMTKIYRAEILLAPVHDDNSPLKSAMGGIGELASLAGVDMKMDDQTPEFVATLTSRLLIEPFIADNNLLPVLFYKRWDPDTHSWRKDMRVPTLQDGYYLLTKGVMSVVEDKLTGLITVKVDWKDPEQAAKWANGLVDRVRQQARERAMHDSDQSIQYLNRELEHTQAVEIRESIFSVLENEINKRMMAATRADFAFRIIDPAQAPQLTRYVRPIPLLMAAIGLFGGGLLGMIAVMLSQRLRARKNS
jgi:capsular polysaccharide biosynthesis protein